MIYFYILDFIICLYILFQRIMEDKHVDCDFYNLLLQKIQMMIPNHVKCNNYSESFTPLAPTKSKCKHTMQYTLL
jgi:hypothetical protein